MSLEIFKVFVAISSWSVAVPLIVYFALFKRMPYANHMIGLALIVAALCELSTNILFAQKTTNVIPVNLYYFLTFFFATGFYVELIFKKKLFFIVRIAIIIYCLVTVLYIAISGFLEFYNGLWALGALLIGIYGLLYKIHLPGMIVEKLLDKNLTSYQIISGSLMAYFIGTLLLFVATDYVFTHLDADTSRAFWSMHNILNALKNIGIALGLFYTGRREVTTTLLEIEKIGRDLARRRTS